MLDLKISDNKRLLVENIFFLNNKIFQFVIDAAAWNYKKNKNDWKILFLIWPPLPLPVQEVKERKLNLLFTGTIIWRIGGGVAQIEILRELWEFDIKTKLNYFFSFLFCFIWFSYAQREDSQSSYAGLLA